MLTKIKCHLKVSLERITFILFAILLVPSFARAQDARGYFGSPSYVPRFVQNLSSKYYADCYSSDVEERMQTYRSKGYELDWKDLESKRNDADQTLTEYSNYYNQTIDTLDKILTILDEVLRNPTKLDDVYHVYHEADVRIASCVKAAEDSISAIKNSCMGRVIGEEHKLVSEQMTFYADMVKQEILDNCVKYRKVITTLQDTYQKNLVTAKALKSFPQ